jgi:hypothetical protein
VRFHLGLSEHRAFFGIDAAGEPIENHLDRVLIELRRIEIGGKRVIVGDEMKILVCLCAVGQAFILKLNPIFQRADVMSQMQFSRRAHAA